MLVCRVLNSSSLVNNWDAGLNIKRNKRLGDYSKSGDTMVLFRRPGIAESGHDTPKNSSVVFCFSDESMAASATVNMLCTWVLS